MNRLPWANETAALNLCDKGVKSYSGSVTKVSKVIQVLTPKASKVIRFQRVSDAVTKKL
jgi:hypothetical protein